MTTEQLSLFPTSKEEVETMLEKLLFIVKYSIPTNSVVEDRIKAEYLKRDLIKALNEYHF